MLHRTKEAVGILRLRDPIALPLTGTEQIVDLNYLYHRQQVSHYMAENAACRSSQLAHLGLAKGYALRIAAVKAARPEATLQA